MKRKITREIFKLPYTQKQVEDMLLAGIKANVLYRNRDIIEDADFMAKLKQVAEFLTDHDERRFGLFFCGNTGNGKTTFMRAIIDVITFFDRIENLSSRHETAWYDSRTLAKLNKEDPNFFIKICEKEILAIDDLGFEPTEILDYGNVLNPVIDLMNYRYNKQLFTLVTTNLTPKEVGEKYGKRISDRFNEMMKVIAFKNPSYRVKK